MRFRIAILITLVAGSTGLAKEKDKTAERLDDAVTVMSEIMDTPDKGIPQDLLDKAQCIVIVPGLKKGAFILGGNTAKVLSVAGNPEDRDGGRRRRSVWKAAAWASRSAARRATS